MEAITKTKNNESEGVSQKINRLADEYFHMKELLKSLERILNNTQSELKRLILDDTVNGYSFTSITHITDAYEIVIEKECKYTLLKDAVNVILNNVPRDLVPLTFKPALDCAQVRYLELNEPEIYRAFRDAFTIDESITVKSVDKV